MADTVRDLQNTILQTVIVGTPVSFRPTSPIAPVPKPIPATPVQTTTATSTASQSQNVVPGKNGIPQPLLSLSVSQEPIALQGSTASDVIVSWTQQVDQNYDHVNVWVIGYHGSSTPLLVASGTVAPLSFVLASTHETISVYAQTVSSTGASAPITQAAHALVTLSGVVSNPPAPTIVQNLIGTPTGFQFSFDQVVLPGGSVDVIDSYKIYRNTANTFGTAALVFTFRHDPTNSGSPIVFTDHITVATGANYWYWVTSVNTAGLESSPSLANLGGAIATGGIGSTPWSITSNFTYTATTTTITWSWSGFLILRSDGTSTSVSNGSQGITGLTSSHTYQFYPYWDEVNAVVAWVAGGSGTPAYAQAAASQALAQSQNLRNRLPLSSGAMPASTPASGSGGGSGGGGGGGGCFSPNSKLLDGRLISEIKDGDTVTSFADGQLVQSKVKQKLLFHHIGSLHKVGPNIYCTPNHRFLVGTEWKRADELFNETIEYDGPVHNLHVDTDVEDHKNYVLFNHLVAHNAKPF